MTVYVIADIKVTDDRWVPAYAASVRELVHKHGGKYLSRSGKVKTSGRQASGYHLYSASGVSIGGISQGLRRGSQIRSLCRGPSGRQREPFQLIDDTDLANESRPRGIASGAASAPCEARQRSSLGRGNPVLAVMR